MGLLYGRAGRLTAKHGGFRPGQWHDDNATGTHAPLKTLDQLVEERNRIWIRLTPGTPYTQYLSIP